MARKRDIEQRLVERREQGGETDSVGTPNESVVILHEPDWQHIDFRVVLDSDFVLAQLEEAVVDVNSAVVDHRRKRHSVQFDVFDSRRQQKIQEQGKLLGQAVDLDLFDAQLIDKRVEKLAKCVQLSGNKQNYLNENAHGTNKSG